MNDSGPERSSPPPTSDGKPRELVGSGLDANVYLSANSDTVLKQYRAGSAAAAAVRHEARFLRLLGSDKAGQLDGVRFPRLVSAHPERGEIEMELAKGTTLSNTSRLEKPSALGRRVARGISHYTDTLGCVYHDCAPDNLTWDAERNEMWMLDVAGNHRAVGPALPPLRDSVSLGYYLGSAAYELARPGRLKVSRLLDEVRLVSAAIEEFRRSDRPVSPRSVARTAWAQYRFAALGRTGLRRLFYGTWGLSIALTAIGGTLLKARRKTTTPNPER